MAHSDIPAAGKRLSQKRSAFYWLSNGVGIPFLTPVSSAWSETLLSEIQTTWREEANDLAVYLAYAHQADTEGLGTLASLYRSLARAEAIHAQVESEMVRTTRGSTGPELQVPVVKTTEENLASALDREERQRHRTYPAPAHRARQQRSSRIVQTLLMIQGAEEQHIALLNQVRSSLRQSGPSEHRYFYVCSKCGYLTDEIAFDMCPNCFDAAAGFEMIS